MLQLYYKGIDNDYQLNFSDIYSLSEIIIPRDVE